MPSVSFTTLLITIAILKECAEASRRNSNSYFSASRIRNLMRARCNNEKASTCTGTGIWAYEGTLTDPFTGARIADCEGLEICSGVEDSTYNSTGGAVGEHLTIGEILNLQQNATKSDNQQQQQQQQSWDFASTLLSRKIFCYRDPSDPRKLLESIRIRPGAGKERRIAKRESVSLYDTATTFVSRNNGAEMVVCTEWPDGRFILGDVTTTSGSGNYNNMDDMTFDFSIYAKRRATESKNDALPPMMIGNDDDDSVKAKLSSSPPRSKLVQFGKDDRSIEQTRYGARESYSYTFSAATMRLPLVMISATRRIRKQLNKRFKARIDDNNEATSSATSIHTEVPTKYSDATVRYSRYGECPPWYGPGKMCTLELVGKRIDSFRDAPPLAARIASEVPGFTSFAAVNTNKAEQLEWFRENTLQLPDDEVYLGVQKLVHTVQAEGLKLWHRLQRSTKLEKA